MHAHATHTGNLIGGLLTLAICAICFGGVAWVQVITIPSRKIQARLKLYRPVTVYGMVDDDEQGRASDDGMPYPEPIAE